MTAFDPIATIQQALQSSDPFLGWLDDVAEESGNGAWIGVANDPDACPINQYLLGEYFQPQQQHCQTDTGYIACLPYPDATIEEIIQVPAPLWVELFTRAIDLVGMQYEYGFLDVSVALAYDVLADVRYALEGAGV